MPDALAKFALAALFALAAHSSVQASSLAPVSEGPTCEADASTASAASSPYYCVCCDATGNASCCSKC